MIKTNGETLIIQQLNKHTKDNSLIYLCGLFDYLARKTKNTRAYIVNKLGNKRLEKIYASPEPYHITDLDSVSETLIKEAQIKDGNFDNVGFCVYDIPTHWDIAKVYKRLIKQVAEYEKINVIEALMNVYNSFISPQIDDYNSTVYCENPSYIFACYIEKQML